jgi:hypothetical protein
MSQQGFQTRTSDGEVSAVWPRLGSARGGNLRASTERSREPQSLVFTRDGHAIRLCDMYRGHAAFLLCGGPSLCTHDLTVLNQRGIVTMAVNNAAAVFRPHLWITVDDPKNFLDAIWLDPGIIKFVPFAHMDRHFRTRDEQGQFARSVETVGDMPGVFAYFRNSTFDVKQFLYEETFNWGNHDRRTDAYGNRGVRSVMLVALRMLFYLGVRRVYLLGCDFRMKHSQPNYAFEQDRSAESVSNNNNTYRVLNVRLNHLKPFFEKEGFDVQNCTPNNELTAFPYVPFEEAIARATSFMPCRLDTSGMYERRHRRKSAAAKDDESVLESAKPESAIDRQRPLKHDGLLSLEIVSHCWKYSRILSFQLSSLILHTPKKITVTMTAFYAPSDQATSTVLEYFEHYSRTNVRWNWQPLDESKLFRRAIGRNAAALATKADWIWFCDCDQAFRENCLDTLAEKLAMTSADLVYPEYVQFSKVQGPDGELLRLADGQPQVLEIDPSQFKPVRFDRAVGGLQIVRGDIARQVGYCKDIPEFMRPAHRWMRTFEDVAFRNRLGIRGQPISVPELYRIEHSIKGRRCATVTL